ncbi:MAG TPA: DUF3226 domain-containing protein [Gemmataceae bacterium]|nr:DUF3226 domain-containing protein [Gemmataceae bacterium]
MPQTFDQPSTIIKPRLLIGEGDEEVFFFGALLAHLNIDDIQVDKFGGKDRLPLYLKELPQRPGFERLVALGVTRDADDDCATAFAKICGALNESGFGFPSAPGQIQSGLMHVGVFVMPDNQRLGMLEDLCLDSFAADPALSCVDEFFRCVDKVTARKPRILAKARVQTWLASHPETDNRLGLAAQKRYWPWNSPAFQPLIDFLRAL